MLLFLLLLLLLSSLFLLFLLFLFLLMLFCKGLLFLVVTQNTTPAGVRMKTFHCTVSPTNPDVDVCFLSVGWLPTTVVYVGSAVTKSAESSRRYREKLKARGPEHYLLYQQQARDRMKRIRDSKRQRRPVSARTSRPPLSPAAPDDSHQPRPDRHEDQQQDVEAPAVAEQCYQYPSQPQHQQRSEEHRAVDLDEETACHTHSSQ